MNLKNEEFIHLFESKIIKIGDFYSKYKLIEKVGTFQYLDEND